MCSLTRRRTPRQIRPMCLKVYSDEYVTLQSMLSEEERRQIQLEEVATARAALAQRQELQRRSARQRYRREVRAALYPRARLALAAGCTLVLVGGVAVSLLRSAPHPRDDTSGGVATSRLMERCEADLQAKVGGAVLHFPALGQTDGQISASPDGKRWDGFFTQDTGNRDAGTQDTGTQQGGGPPVQTDFSCVYTLATDEIGTELITP